MKLTNISKQILGVMLGYSIAMLITALAVGDWAASWQGFLTIQDSPSQLTIDYFKLGTVGGTFLNTSLVGLACVLLCWVSRGPLNGLTLMAYFLTGGFSFFGINVLNIWPIFLGTWIFARVTGQRFGTQVNFAMFATALAPFVSEALCRYPVFDALPGEVVLEVLLALVLGFVAGFFLPVLCKYGPNIHKGYTLYNAASMAGFLGIFLYAMMFKAIGIEAPTNTDIGQSHLVAVNNFAILADLAMIAAGFVMNGKSFKGYKQIITATGYSCDFTDKTNVGLTIINVGIFGLFSSAYYHIAGANFTGPTVGCMVCLLAIAPMGAHILNVLPIMIGYAIAAAFGDFTLSTQAIVVGFCFAGAMAPISGRFGSLSGVIAGLIHACIVTTVVTFHGGFCLYNGGFTAAVTVITLLPILDYFFEPQDKLRLLPKRKKAS